MLHQNRAPADRRDRRSRIAFKLSPQSILHHVSPPFHATNIGTHEDYRQASSCTRQATPFLSQASHSQEGIFHATLRKSQNNPVGWCQSSHGDLVELFLFESCSIVCLWREKLPSNIPTLLRYQDQNTIGSSLGTAHFDECRELI